MSASSDQPVLLALVAQERQPLVDDVPETLRRRAPDTDPFAACLQFPVHMVRQNSHRPIAGAWRLIEAAPGDPVLIEGPPELLPPRRIYKGLSGETG